MDYKFSDLKYPHEIHKIYHISDIHIRLRQRHQEYREVFANLYKFLLEQKNKKHSLIVITGDLLHSKTELSPECIDLTCDFLQNLSSIMNVILIAGNHDANLNNKDRMDSITPIVNKIIKTKKKKDEIHSACFYLKETAVYRFNNVFFGIASVFDYNVVPGSLIQQGITKTYPELKNTYKIALFHGRLDGAITDTGAVMEGEKDTNSTNINCSSFKDYDYTILGDIHKHQFLNKNKTIGYAGSLIQQNHGESNNYHGVLIWNLQNGKTKFQEITNQYGFRTLKINDDKSYLDHIKTLPKKCYLRIEYENDKTNVEIDQLVDKISTQCHIEHLITFKTGSNTNSDYFQEISSNVLDSNYQNQEIEKILSLDKSITKGQIEKIKTMNKKLSDEVLLESGSTLFQKYTTGSWKLLTLEFSNLFCYGEKNYIDFRKQKGILGIHGENHIGKSAIIDIILYTLFDKFSRKGTGNELMNINKKTFDIKLRIKLGEYEYVIRKYGGASYAHTKFKSSRGFGTRIEFLKYDSKGNVTSLEGVSQLETKKKIIETFGSYDDMVMTSISLQNNNTRFADSSNIERKKELEKLLHIDYLEKVKDKVQEHYRDVVGIIKYLNKDEPSQKLRELNNEHDDIEDDLEEIKDKITVAVKEIEILQTNLEAKLENKPSLPDGLNYQYLTDIESQLLTKQKFLKNKLKQFNKSSEKEYSLEKYQKMEQKHAKWIKEKNQQIKKLNGKIVETTSKIIILTKLGTDYGTRKEELNSINTQLTNLTGKIKELDKQANIFEQELNSVVENIISAGKNFNQIKTLILEFIEKERKFSKETNQKKVALVEESHHLKTNKINLKREIKEIKDNSLAKKNNKEIKNQINNLRNQITSWEENNDNDYDTYIEKYHQFHHLGGDRIELIEVERELKKINDQVKLFNQVEIFEDEIEGLRTTLEHKTDTLKSLKKSELEHKSSIESVNYDIEITKEKIKELDEKKEEKILYNAYLSALKIIPFKIIQKIAPTLEQTVNQMLKSLVNFHLKFFIDDKSFNVFLHRGKDPVKIPLSNGSGFEKFIGSLFIRIALIKISNLPKANFLIVDEGWSNFDYNNINNIGLIFDYLRSEFDFVLAISHLQSLKESFDSHILITVNKAKGESLVQYPHNSELKLKPITGFKPIPDKTQKKINKLSLDNVNIDQITFLDEDN